MSLRTRILITILIAVGATTIIGALAVNNRIQVGARREANTQANAYSSQVQSIYRERAATLVAEGEAISLYPAVVAAIVDGNATPLLTWSSQVTSLQGTKVTVTDAGGRVIARGHAPGLLGDDLTAKLEGIRAALHGDRTSGVEAGDELGLALRGFAPVRSSGKVVGAVMIADQLDERLIQRLTGGEASSVRASVAPGAGSGEGCRAEQASTAVCQFTLASPEGRPAASMSLSVPLSSIDAAREDAQLAVLVIGAIVLAVGAVAALVLSASLTRPLTRLTAAAERMAGGSYDEPVNITLSKDEIGALAGAFEAMRREVERASQALRDETNTLDSVVESVDAGIVMTDGEGGKIVANRRWSELTGSEDLWAAAELTRAGGGSGTFGLAARTWLANASYAGQADFERVGQVYRRFRCYTAPVQRRGTDDRNWRRIFVLRDVTAETEAERMRSAFVAMVSHELRSPLTAVKGYTETLLQAGPWDAATEREFLEIVAASAERLSVLIDNLLDAAQAEAGVLRLTREPVRMERLIDSVVRQHQGQLVNHPLTTDIEPDLPLAIADPVRVEQVLGNLVENAIKYSPEGGPIKVTVENREMLTVSVSDSGVGIGPEDQERVFERFFRAGPKSGGSPKGVGLGLYICKSLVEGHGGRIWVESEPGAGSTFWFTLPRLEDLEVESPPSALAFAGARGT